MNKSFLNIAMAALLLTGSATGFVGCKDYDDDIDNLQGQIDQINVSLKKLQDLIDSGMVVKSVTSTANGVEFLMSDGKTYTITNGKDGQNGQNGQNGQDGQNGKDGTAWTIGDDGYWYENGKKTNYRAIGEQGPKGEQGEQGTPGTPGAPGAPGMYYVPNADGTFWIHGDGNKDPYSSGISWRPAAEENKGITAVFTGTELILSGVTGADKDVVLPMGTPLGSIAFIPSVLSSVGGYPTTDKPIYTLVNYYDESKFVASTKAFIAQTAWDKSNVVATEYRVSPQDAYIAENASASFINRSVISRAAEGDGNGLMTVRSFDAEGANATGVLLVKTLYNQTKAAKRGNDIVAMQLWNGQVPFTSDYIAPVAKGIDAIIVNPKDVTDHYYPRLYAIPTAADETSAFIQNTVGLKLTDPANTVMAYDKELDIATLVDLYSPRMSELLSKLDFDGIRFEYSLPKEYLADDVQHTNQQWFVQLDGSKLKANAGNLTGGLTPAIGRTPVVRVDAMVMANDGKTEKLVASCYIKVSIEPVAPDPGQEQPLLRTEMTPKAFEYHALTNNKTLVGQMNWMDVNNSIYGKSGLSSSTFWNYYGGDNDVYEVEISVIDNGAKKVLNPNNKVAYANTPFSLAQDGIFCDVTLGSSNTQTSNIRFDIDNKIKTGNTYDRAHKGAPAKYTVTIRINSDNDRIRGNVVIVQEFSVNDECKEYEFNKNYYYGTFQGHENCVITKGTNASGNWKLEMNIAEVFAMRNGKSIYSYYNTVNNAKAITFSMLPGQTGATISQETLDGVTTDKIALAQEMKDEYKFVNMQYDVTLVNNEKCNFKFTIAFQNPFKQGDVKALSINGNEIGEVTLETKPQVNVIDVLNHTIYNWSATANKLMLSTTATGTYKLTDSMVKVTYKFNKNKAYNDFVGQLAPTAVFKIDENTGVITYNNLGASLVPSFDLEVIATVTIENISIIDCKIPVQMQGMK